MNSASTYVVAHPPDSAPEPANAAQTSIGWTRWREQADAASDQRLRDAMYEAEHNPARRWLDAIFGNSPYLTLLALREPELVVALLERGPDHTLAELMSGLNQERPEQSTPQSMSRLRVAKRRAALLIGMADIAELWPLRRITEALSVFADLALTMALRRILFAANAAGQIDLGDQARPEAESGIFVLGMGKLGALELNYSSDIDLIVLFDPEKIRFKGRDSVQSFAVRVTRDLVTIMEERTVDGYVFRTDLRLRPDPRSTPLAVSVEAAETYYGSIGQNWERAALIKARPVAGDIDLGRKFLGDLRPFIWRKHLDFAAIRDIQSIKRQIDVRHGAIPHDLLGHNIKLGHGGIREIEFFAQTQQLIWGGRLQQLRKPATVDALNALVTADRIEPAVATELTRAYEMLRRVEHRLQMIGDQQTHSLPNDPAAFAQLAIFLGYTDAAALAAALELTLRTVQRRFGELFPGESSLGHAGNLVFTGADDDPETSATLTAMGFADPARVSEVIRGWHHGHIRATRSARARELLTELIPRMLDVVHRTADPDLVFARFDEFLSHLPAGVQMLTLFQHRPELLDLVAEIMGQSPLLAGQLARRPILLDAVITGDFFTSLQDDSAAAIAWLGTDLDLAIGAGRHYEEILESVRRWAADKRFQIGVQLLQNRVDGERAGRDFTLIAEIVIGRLLPVVTTEFETLHGEIPGSRFSVLALGKLGSREMNLLSDLDLVFLYETPDAASTGRKPLPATAYFARLGQRLINALMAPMADGSLYEVDMRLRPSGNAGPIASSIASFLRYYAEQAWSWERMALTRARVVAGDPLMVESITDHIRVILLSLIEPEKLRGDVIEMRERIVRSRPAPHPWDCKHRRGALVDLEFIAQYLQLRYATENPAILHWQTSEAFVSLRRAGYLTEADADSCVTSLKLWHQCQQRLRVLLGKTESAPLSSALGLDALERALQAGGRGQEILEEASSNVMRIYRQLL